MLANWALLITLVSYVVGHYTPTWSSLDSRPLPKWYDEAKIGILLRWGLFSVPSCYTAWFWYYMKSNTSDVANFMKRNYKPGFQYPGFASHFTAEFYDPNRWAEIFASSGEKYVVLNSKHHEGYTMWPSKFSWNWNVQDNGPGRDLLGELAAAIRKKTDLRFGVLYSLKEWYHPLYLEDKKNSFKTSSFVETKIKPELMDLVTKYKPEVIYSMGDDEAPETYWKSKEFLAWLYNESPVKDVVAVNDRWGIGTGCKHGGYFSCYNKSNPHKFETGSRLNKHNWVFTRNAQLSDFFSIEEVIAQLAVTISRGGNILINAGPSHEGVITPLQELRLRQLGTWLKINGEAIYKSQPWTYHRDTITSTVRYTTRGNYVYAIVLNWPKNSTLTLGTLNPPEESDIFMLGVNEPLTWKSFVSKKQTVINFPSLTPEAVVQWAWVLKIPKIPY